jgi:integrase/recombinase XerC
MKRLRPPIRYLTPSQVTSVIETASSARDKALLAVIYQCGLRRGEVKYLRRRDWDPTKSAYGALTVWRLKRGEGIEPEEKPVWKRTRNLLEAYLGSRDDDNDALFLGKKDPQGRRQALGPQAVYMIFRKVARKAGLPRELQHPHVLRHSIATHHANMGSDFSDIQNLLGHRSISSTMRYAQVLNPRKEDMTMRAGASPCFARWK